MVQLSYHIPEYVFSLPWWLHILPLLSFLGMLFLPEISKPLDRNSKEHLAWKRGLVAGLITFVLFLPAFFVPIPRIDLMLPWILVAAFWGVLVGLYQPQFKLNHFDGLSLDNRKQLIELEIDKYGRAAVLSFPILVAIMFSAIFSLAIAPPQELADIRNKSADMVPAFLQARTTGYLLTLACILAGILYLLFNIGLRLHFAYNGLRKLLSEKEPVDV